jgi:hypothetical protein
MTGPDTSQWASRAAGGLPVRTPRGQESASLAAGAGAVPAGGPSFSRGGSLPVRSAEQVRSRLTGFQRGARRAEGQNGQNGQNGHNGHDGQPPRAGEGTMN